MYATLDAIPYHRFADLFAGKLLNRRLFLSACQVGNAKLVKEVSDQNKGMYSILAPCEKIPFSHAMAIWSSFYVNLFDINPAGPKNQTITSTLDTLCSLFGANFHWSYHETAVKDEWVSRIIGPAAVE